MNLERLLPSWRTLVRQLATFGVVGAGAYVVDVSTFNLLQHTGDNPMFEGQPLMAKVASTGVATVFSWVGNRYWTFRHQRRKERAREFLLYLLMCTIGLGIALGILWISHYVLGFASPLADNIAANVIGLVAGTAFRFYAYRTFVFTSPTEPSQTHDLPAAVAAAGLVDEAAAEASA
ncbi:GtrA family protein [Lapillicoccus sp.]|uniref:GtrA family protein n=1 Tax=Lapillicoccus sp. TaxID=1909287 RepID=UPI003263A27A